VSQCDVTEKSERVIVNVYNPQANFINKYVRIPVQNLAYRVFDPSGIQNAFFIEQNNIFLLCCTGKTIPFDFIPIPEFIKTLPGRNSSATHELVFLVFQLPPLGSKSYYIKVENKSKTAEVKSESNGNFIGNQVGSNNNLKLLMIMIFTYIYIYI